MSARIGYVTSAAETGRHGDGSYSRAVTVQFVGSVESDMIMMFDWHAVKVDVGSIVLYAGGTGYVIDAQDYAKAVQGARELLTNNRVTVSLKQREGAMNVTRGEFDLMIGRIQDLEDGARTKGDRIDTLRDNVGALLNRVVDLEEAAKVERS